MKFKQLRDEFGRLHGEATAVIEKAAGENRELTADEKSGNETRFGRMKQIKDLLDEDARFAGLALVGDPAAPAGGTVTTPTDAPGRTEFQQQGEQFAPRPGETPEAAQFRQHKAAVNQFIRTGLAPQGLKFTLTTGSGSGVLLPTAVGTPVVIKRQRNPFRAALMARGLQVIRTDGMEQMTVPIFDDSANAGFTIAQDSTAENNADPAVSSLTLGADLLDSGTVWSSNTLLNSLTYDLLGYLQPMLEARIENREVAVWTAAVVAGATVGKTTASTNGVTYGELLDWQHSIPAERRGDGVFFLSDGLFRAIRGLVDSTGQPIYQESLRDDAPNTLLGWPVFVAAALAAPAAAAVSGIAASAESMVVRDVNNRRIARYTNIPTHPDQFGLRMFTNGGFAFHTGGVRALKHAAS
jgi:HK97 family phage major capsid protein